MFAVRSPRRCSPRRCSPLSATLLWAILLSAGAGLASCVPDRSQGGRASTTGGGSAEPGQPALDLTGEATWPAAYATDPLWVRASTGDDLDHARLARSESGSSLVAALAHGGSLGRTALAAFAYVRDRRDARSQLCELVRGPSTATTSLLLAALHEAVSNGPLTEESIDPQADARCARRLRELASGDDLGDSDRDRALGTLARLESR